MLNLISQCQYHQSQYCIIGLQTNYNHLLQETQCISLPFITTGPGSNSPGPGDIKLLNRSVYFMVDQYCLQLRSHQSQCDIYVTVPPRTDQ